MAEHRGLLLFHFSLLALSICPVTSRRYHSPPYTATLNVSDSLAKAHTIVSFDPTADPHFADHHNSSSSDDFSIQFVSRDLLPSSHGYATGRPLSYQALTVARLRRDAARVRYIGHRFRAAASADLKNPPSLLKGQIYSGRREGNDEYLSRVLIGTPARSFYMVLDTGSDVSWIQCLPCANCYEQSDAVFDPSASSSYTPLSCESPRCRDLGYGYACVNSTISSSSATTGSGGGGDGAEGSCLYESWYGDNSFSIGDFATETVGFSREAEFSGLSIGCGHDNEGLFYGSAGILGLGAGSLSFVSQVSARSLSYCLVDRDSIAASTLRIGSRHGGRAEITAPLIRNGTAIPYYYVELTGISVGGKMLDAPPSTFAVNVSNWGGGVILDTGTVVTRLFGKVYAALRDAFRAGTAALPAAEAWSIFDTCYNLTGLESVEVPTVAFHFPRGQELQLPAKNYLIPVDDAGTHCLAFAPSSVPANIIGSVQHQGIRVSIDLVRSRVGFTRRMC
ncbi:hypothetical protein ZIOFF_038435 [Zingiber officinale]|uniref:Peptidase A1 domain-containing protein n=2 Tax=Zingiber officinale TaxID=94328 RepID=A0A8J5KSL4_ZINOF|nr:hypothetical protein ZIOFF_038435 [Zingiber officinale]